MAGFVLIHGAWHGGWCFDPVTALLCERGHKVVAPDLPGMGGDAESLRGVTVQGWAEFTAGLCHELRRAHDEHQLGRPIAEVLAAMGERLPGCAAVETFVVGSFRAASAE